MLHGAYTWLEYQWFQGHIIGNCEPVHISVQFDALHLVARVEIAYGQRVRAHVHRYYVGVEVETQIAQSARNLGQFDWLLRLTNFVHALVVGLRGIRVVGDQIRTSTRFAGNNNFRLCQLTLDRSLTQVAAGSFHRCWCPLRPLGSCTEDVLVTVGHINWTYFAGIVKGDGA